MKFYSTENPNASVDLREAVLQSLPRDGGLYMPVNIPRLDAQFIAELAQSSFPEQSYQIAKSLLGNSLPHSKLQEIVYGAISFPAPLVELKPGLSALELFHGPSLAFKDFGARFMARIMSYFLESAASTEKVTVLVATSGDTGGAVGAGFLNVPGTEVIILYPSGRVSALQEKQLTTLGGNIHACEIQGSFDDCQSLVKQAFLDPALSKQYNLSSANSINIARLIPQIFYYFEAFRQLDTSGSAVFVVPSGNYGNLTAGLIAKRMGLPIRKFIAASNSNDVVPNYLKSGIYEPKPSVATLSNAMDVGSPSNFARILDLYGSTWNQIKEDVSGAALTDKETVSALAECFRKFNYVCDPHGAIGYRVAQRHLDAHPNCQVTFLETAHPSKFLPTVEEAIGSQIAIPNRLKILETRTSLTHLLSNSYQDFRAFLLARDK